MKPLVIFDIDGTLRDERYGIPASAKKAIHLCKQAQVPLCICTGRSPSMIQEDVKALQIENLIAAGGCYISHKQQVIKQCAFPKEAIKQVLAYITTSDSAISMESLKQVFMNQVACDILNHMNAQKTKDLSNKQLQQFLAQEKIIYQDNLAMLDLNQDAIHKLCLWSSKEVFQEIQNILKESMTLAQSGPYKEQMYYEIIQRGCRKADAIQTLCDYLHIDIEHTIAFGDGMNDADMLQICGSGIAVATSDARLFPYADTICEAPMSDGIYKELQRRTLIRSEEQ